MARSQQIVRSGLSPDVVFDFVSDFRHAPLWDPQVRVAEKVTGGPIGVGTRFLLRGAVASLPLTLPYEIVVYERPYRVVLTGRTRLFRYRDALTLVNAGGGTRLDYDAELELLSVMRAINPLAALIFLWIADVATRGMAHAIERHAGRSSDLSCGGRAKLTGLLPSPNRQDRDAR